MNQTLETLSKTQLWSIRIGYIVWMLIAPIVIAFGFIDLMNPQDSAHEYVPYFVGAIDVVILYLLWKMHALHGAALNYIGDERSSLFIDPPTGYQYCSKFSYWHGFCVLMSYAIIQVHVWGTMYQGTSIRLVTIGIVGVLICTIGAIQSFKIELEPKNK